MVENTPAPSGEVQLRIGGPEDVAAVAATLGGVLDAGSPDTWLGHDLCVAADQDDRTVGVLRLSDVEGHAAVTAIMVVPDVAHAVIEVSMVEGAAQLATDLGSPDLRVKPWSTHPGDRSAFLARLREHGFRADAADLMRRLPVRVEVPTAEDMRDLGRALTTILRAGDVVVASGDLGAGKTTLAQGIGAGLDVEGPVISPTFVLVRRHAGTGGRPGFVHVDAYRLGSLAELVDLDLDETMDESVTLVEWGAGIAEELERSYLSLDIRRSGDPADDTRIVYLEPVGTRWEGVDLGILTALETGDEADEEFRGGEQS
ncbi:tRNA (adenosine(37)-N6)-threonylcarbamoyltransferase complex ATPase subunit type 1 TsaE [Acidipropionibacterium virtanenii]|uniref:tRNA threonylcarbamoyladenosine biosynthesis protein TsaE n=1 Tax=Acidipropionibacterium virtanenii TaxID=2057246 RepID=A0A344USD9_9ACTN|nr:tRNA (adenosine(37)-N6)-threonylcarbamoyltransferase complex ATPase subunit type 1 TsaE [Acidipropionibacterium virtanenii]AXE38187.1 tRNA threonylcarbamoyladenosine biosynthesis protein TsaE [Acidipropionibacterium virtanenii]